MVAERVQKLLARAGIAARRRGEEMVLAGRVLVNGEPAHLGSRADPELDTILVDGLPLTLPSDRVYLALHKPVDYVCTHRDPQRRPSIFDLVPAVPGLVSVGRLDQDTSGLLLLTNDGAWANHIAHPRYGVEKEYRASVQGVPGQPALLALETGVELSFGRTAPARAWVTDVDAQQQSSVVHIVLHEGHKRQVRLMCAHLGYPVMALQRVRVGPIRLADLAVATVRPLTSREMQALAQAVVADRYQMPRIAAPARREDHHAAYRD